MMDTGHWDGLMKRMQNQEKLPYKVVYDIGDYIKSWSARPNFVRERALRKLKDSFPEEGGHATFDELEKMRATSAGVQQDNELISQIHRQLMDNGYNWNAVQLPQQPTARRSAKIDLTPPQT